MAPTPTTTDAFNAVADVSRRRLLDAIGTGEVTVNELVERLGLSQPQVSKHLAVLRQVDLVRVRQDGRHRWYRVNGPVLQPIHDWVLAYARHLEHPSRPPRRPARRAHSRGGTHDHHQEPPRIRRRHAPVRHRDPHHPPVRRPGVGHLQGRHDPRARQALVGLRHLRLGGLRDRPPGRRLVALRHQGGRHGGRLPRRVPGDRRTAPHRLHRGVRGSRRLRDHRTIPTTWRHSTR